MKSDIIFYLVSSIVLFLVLWTVAIVVSIVLEEVFTLWMLGVPATIVMVYTLYNVIPRKCPHCGKRRLIRNLRCSGDRYLTYEGECLNCHHEFLIQKDNLSENSFTLDKTNNQYYK